jgi:hypothetical protein
MPSNNFLVKAGQCKHKWYMREHGITCIYCFILWDKGIDTDSASLDA